MDRDMNSLAILSQRHETFIHHPASVDKKMRDILLISPNVQRLGIHIEEVKEDDVHKKETRLNEERKEALLAQQEKKKVQEEKDQMLELLSRESIVLKELETKG